MVARRLASRLPVVREAAAETAYLAGHYDTALTEYRALHRITGDDDYLPIIADCERAVGKHQAALRTLREARDLKLSLPQQVEVILVEAGVDDMGQRDEASRLLKEAISGGRGGRQGQARLRFAYADLLAEHGRPDAALEWLTSARTYDESNELEIDDRIAELKGEPVAEAPDLDEFEVLGVEEVDGVDDEPAEADDSQEESVADPRTMMSPTMMTLRTMSLRTMSLRTMSPTMTSPITMNLTTICRTSRPRSRTKTSNAGGAGRRRAGRRQDERRSGGAVTRFIDAYDAAMFDLDGVVYLGPRAVEGSLRRVSENSASLA